MKKQVIVYKCNVSNKTHNGKNVLIHGIDWNKNNNIIVGVNISIFLFSFSINNNSINNNDKYCLSLTKGFPSLSPAGILSPCAIHAGSIPAGKYD